MRLFGRPKVAARELVGPWASLSAGSIADCFSDAEDVLDDFAPFEVLKLLFVLDDLARLRAVQSVEDSSRLALEGLGTSQLFAPICLEVLGQMYETGEGAAVAAQDLVSDAVRATIEGDLRDDADLDYLEEIADVLDSVDADEVVACDEILLTYPQGNLVVAQLGLEVLDEVELLVRTHDEYIDDESGLGPVYWVSKAAVVAVGGDPESGGGLGAMYIRGVITSMTLGHHGFLKALLDDVRVVAG